MTTTDQSPEAPARGARSAPTCGAGARPPAPRMRPSRTSRWRALVLLGVHVAIALHIAHWYVSGTTLSPLEPAEAMEFSKEGVINAGFVFFALAILATALFGRFFCGWGCHLLALQDGSSWLLKKIGIRPRPLRSRVLLLVPAAAFVYMFLWPLAARLYLGYAGHGGVALTKADFWETFPPWPIALATFLVCGFAIVYFLGSKGFCTYACPYGAIFGAVDRVSPGRIRVTDACEGCGHCTATCTSNVLVHAEVRDYGMVVDPGCMKCMDCVSVCPKGALYFGFGAPAAFSGPRAKRPAHARGARLVREKVRRWKELSRGDELLLAALFVAALATFRGLYGLVPFLMSLGLSAVLAFLGLALARTLSGKEARLGGIHLRRGDALTRSGRVFVGAMAALLLAWAHSGAVRFRDWRADAAVERLGALGAASGPADLELARAGLAHALFVERWAPAPLALDAWRAKSAERVAWLERLLGDGAAFEAWIRRSLELAPARADLRLVLAEHLEKSGRLEEALAELGRGPGGASADPRTAAGAARLLARSGRLDEADEAFRTGLTRSPGHPSLLFDHGVFLASIGRLAEASERFAAVVELQPDSVPALENLAGALCGLGHFREGLERFEQALALSPRDPSTRLLATRAALELGELARAELHAREAARLVPGSPAPWLALAEIARRRGDEGEARRLELRAGGTDGD